MSETKRMYPTITELMEALMNIPSDKYDHEIRILPFYQAKLIYQQVGFEVIELPSGAFLGLHKGDNNE